MHSEKISACTNFIPTQQMEEHGHTAEHSVINIYTERYSSYSLQE